MYFITICTKDKEHYFGEIADGIMNLSEVGECLQEQITQTPEIRADMNVEIPLFVIMATRDELGGKRGCPPGLGTDQMHPNTFGTHMRVIIS